MHAYVLELLECPRCHGELEWHIGEREGERIETAAAQCRVCAAVYPVREGIGLFFVQDAQDLSGSDLWEQAGSGLARYLQENPDLEQQLLGVPVESLAPADQLFRAFILEERGYYEQAKATEQLARQGLYTREYLACWQSQIDYILEHLTDSNEPLIDLASGRGYLVEILARTFNRPIIATDVSPRVLRGNRRRLQFFGLYDQLTLLAFDARQTPFKNGSIPILTSNVGLPNIQEPGDLLQELRRIVSGQLLAISQFYPEDDKSNRTALQEAGLASLLYRRSTLDSFTAAGWQVKVANICQANATPTPLSIIFTDARPDAFPITATTLEWCLLVAT